MSIQSLVTEAIRHAREAGETSITIDYADDGTADVTGGNGFYEMVGYRFAYDPATDTGSVVYDAPGAPRIHS